ncbi:MAG: PIN domain-containing protein [Nitrospinae bacterium]|nr:PIN domain-containing protein [Nitrospinota bacterium]
MLTGVDTGFFFALEDEHPLAVKAWKEQEIVTSTIVLYELQKKLLQGHFNKWPKIIEDIKIATALVSISPEIALKAGHLSHDLKIPGLDSLILSSLLETGCKEIYTTDDHFDLYSGIKTKIINLQKTK